MFKLFIYWLSFGALYFPVHFENFISMLFLSRRDLSFVYFSLVVLQFPSFISLSPQAIARSDKGSCMGASGCFVGKTVSPKKICWNPNPITCNCDLIRK